jgi:CubicO group peptidase (beta-lactamase class C family)
LFLVLTPFVLLLFVLLPFPLSSKKNPKTTTVRETYADLFAGGHDVGSSFAAFVNGKKVVDIWAGRRFASSVEAREFETNFGLKPHTVSTDEPWTEDTVALMFSTTKGMAMLAMGMLVDRGLLDLDAPVVKYWPNFGHHGKDKISVRHILKHETGILMPKRSVNWAHIEDVNVADRSIEEADPLWKRDTVSRADDTQESPRGYGAVVFGDLVNGVFRRVDKKGRTVGAFLRDEVFSPLGLEAQFFLGVNSTLLERRFSPPHPMPFWDVAWRSIVPALLDLDVRPVRERLGFRKYFFGDRTFHDPFINVFNHTDLGMRKGTIDAMKKRRFVTRDQPASNGIGSARAIASVYAALANKGKLGSVRLISEATLASLLSVCKSEPKFDDVLNFESTFTDGGWGHVPPGRTNGRHLIGWGGYGGSIGGFNPEFKLDDGSTVAISVSYIPNALGLGVDWRAGALLKAVTDSLHAQQKKQ